MRCCSVEYDNTQDPEEFLEEFKLLPLDVRQALNFRRTYFYFINYVMVLFQKQGLPTFRTLEDLIEYDKEDRKLRQLIHNYLHAQLLIRHKRKEGKYTE